MNKVGDLPLRPLIPGTKLPRGFLYPELDVSSDLVNHVFLPAKWFADKYFMKCVPDTAERQEIGAIAWRLQSHRRSTSRL